MVGPVATAAAADNAALTRVVEQIAIAALKLWLSRSGREKALAVEVLVKPKPAGRPLSCRETT